MSRTFKSYTADTIKPFLYSYPFTRSISAIHIHHTWKPTKGAISIEIIGNFDVEILKGPQKKAVIELIRTLLKVCDLSKQAIIFHREHSTKTCPGKNIQKDEFLGWLDEQPKTEFVHIRPVEIIRKDKTYKGYVLPDGKGYVEVRQLLEDLGERVDWENEKITILPPNSPEEKLNQIKIIVG